MKAILLTGLIGFIVAGNLCSAETDMKSEEAKTWMAYAAVIIGTDAALGSDLLAFNAAHIEECRKRLLLSEAKAHPMFPEMQYALAKNKPLPSDFKVRLCQQ